MNVSIWFLSIVGGIIVLLFASFVCWMRVFIKRGQQNDRLAGKTPEEKRRNLTLMTTLIWANLMPMFLVFPLVSDLGLYLAVTFGIPTEGKSANVLYVTGYFFLVVFPLTGLASLLGKRLWKQIASKYYPASMLNKFINDRWWKFSGGD